MIKQNHNIYFIFKIMSERKLWTPEVTNPYTKEDKILKMLRQDIKLKKWSQIAKKMSQDYSLTGRNGKQCRQRYHNHLQSGITKGNWTPQQEETLIKLHNEVGNRWAMISRELPGRRQNCVKNHFYSKFKKSIKQINELICENFKKILKPVKISIVHKIIQLGESYLNDESVKKREIYEICRGTLPFIPDLKVEIMSFSQQTNFSKKQQLEILIKLVGKINSFSKKYKMKKKKKKQDDSDMEDIYPRKKVSKYQSQISSKEAQFHSEHKNSYSINAIQNKEDSINLSLDKLQINEKKQQNYDQSQQKKNFSIFNEQDIPIKVEEAEQHEDDRLFKKIERNEGQSIFECSDSSREKNEVMFDISEYFSFEMIGSQ